MHETKSEEEISNSEMMNFVKGMIRQNMNFSKIDVTKIFQESKRPRGSKGMTKSKSNVIYFECNRKWYYKSKWLELNKSLDSLNEEE